MVHETGQAPSLLLIPPSLTGTILKVLKVPAVTGGGLGHDHTFTGTAINLAVQYVDVIIATKD